MHQRQDRKDVLDEAELLDVCGGAVVRLRFRGPFEGRTVTWLATLRALATLEPDGKNGAQPASYIEIGQDAAEGVPITVGLPVAVIDEPTIRKAMIMIRRYRRLRRGRHEYGPAARAAPRTDP